MNLNLLQVGPPQTLGWALIHFLWQGVGIAAVVKLALAVLERRSPQARYLAACCGLGALLLCPLVTFCVLPLPPVRTGAELAQGTIAGTTAEQGEHVPFGPERVIEIARRPHAALATVPERLNTIVPWVLLSWSAGVLMLSIRLAAGWWRVKQLAQDGLPLDEAAWRDRLARAAQRVGMTRPVQLVHSTLVRVPTVLGWLRPVVLLPVSSLTGLDPVELEVILSHELVHVRRHDYLVNFLQSVVETLLFYHPAVWWISNQIRTEREHVCDDLVVAAYGDPVRYARALASLEEGRSNSLAGFALSASGGSLLQRVRRLFGKPVENRTSPSWLVGMTVPVAFACWLLAERNAPASGSHSGLAQVLRAPEMTASTPASTLAPKEPQPNPQPILVGASEQVEQEGTSTELAKPAEFEKPKLFTRSYKVDPKTFVSAIRSALLRGPVESDTPEMRPREQIAPDPALGPPLGQLELFGDPASRWVRDYFRAAGFDTRPIDSDSASLSGAQRALFFNPKTGMILVRATTEELDRVERAIEAVKVVPPPAVMIDIKFTEVLAADLNELGLGPLPDGKSEDLKSPFVPIQITNRNGVITQPTRDEKGNLVGQLFDNPGLRNVEQVRSGIARTISAERFRIIIHALEQRAGADLLAAPRVTTLSGRPARIEVIEVKQVVTGVSISIDAQNKSTVNYLPSALPTGPAVDVLPEVAADGKTIRLSVSPSWTEFLGYDDPGGPFVSQGGLDGKPLKAQRPLPHFQARQTKVDVTVRDGETIVISGFGGSQHLSKNPIGGKSFKKASTALERELIVFVTPVIVNSAGKRVHPE